jgi:hypothetical protein
MGTNPSQTELCVRSGFKLLCQLENVFAIAISLAVAREINFAEVAGHHNADGEAHMHRPGASFVMSFSKCRRSPDDMSTMIIGLRRCSTSASPWMARLHYLQNESADVWSSPRVHRSAMVAVT